MKTVSKEKLKQMVAEKGLSVTRGKQPKEKAAKPINQNTNISKMVVESAKTVLQIAESVNESSKNVSRATKNIETLIQKMKPLDQKIEVIEKESGSKKCKYTIVRNKYTNLIDSIIKEEL